MKCPKGVACPRGLYDQQVPCGPGYYSTEGMMHCEASPPGKYAPDTVNEPVDCPDGTWADVAQTSCMKCPPGFACPDKTGRHMTLCEPGSFYDGSKGECTPCEAGKMCPIAIPGFRAGGIQCPAGTWAKPHSFDCELCRPGRDCSKTAD